MPTLPSFLLFLAINYLKIPFIIFTHILFIKNKSYQNLPETRTLYVQE